MKGGNIPDSTPDTGNVDADEVSTNEDGTTVPIFAGEGLFAVRWICEPFGQFTREAPAERPGKK